MSRLTHDIDNTQLKRIVEILAADCDTFSGYTVADLEEMLTVLKVVSFKQ